MATKSNKTTKPAKGAKSTKSTRTAKEPTMQTAFETASATSRTITEGDVRRATGAELRGLYALLMGKATASKDSSKLRNIMRAELSRRADSSGADDEPAVDTSATQEERPTLASQAIAAEESGDFAGAVQLWTEAAEGATSAKMRATMVANAASAQARLEDDAPADRGVDNGHLLDDVGRAAIDHARAEHERALADARALAPDPDAEIDAEHERVMAAARDAVARGAIAEEASGLVGLYQSGAIDRATFDQRLAIAVEGAAHDEAASDEAKVFGRCSECGAEFFRPGVTCGKSECQEAHAAKPAKGAKPRAVKDPSKAAKAEKPAKAAKEKPAPADKPGFAHTERTAGLVGKTLTHTFADKSTAACYVRADGFWTKCERFDSLTGAAKAHGVRINGFQFWGLAVAEGARGGKVKAADTFESLHAELAAVLVQVEGMIRDAGAPDALKGRTPVQLTTMADDAAEAARLLRRMAKLAPQAS